MSKIYSPRIVTDSLVMCLDASQNKSYPTTDLPVKAGLLLWLDAADDTTFSYSSGTLVSQWRDKSGLNNHTNQSNVAYQPQRNTFTNSRKTTVFNSSYLTTQTNILKAYTSYTKIAVVKQTSNAVGNIIGKSTGADTTFWYNGSNNIRLYHNASTILTSSVATTLNTWSILSGLFDSNLLNANIYVNGSSGGSATSPTVTQITTDSDVEIGGFNGAANYFAGEISEILIYNRALSLTELKQVHTYLGQKWGISNTDRSIIDLSGFNDNGLLGNGTTANMPVYDYYNKGSLNFDGSNDYITIPSSASIKNTSSLTLEAWIYISNSMNYYGGIFGKGTTDIDEEYCLLVHSVNSKVYMDVGSSGGPYTDATFSFSLNTWYHIIGTHERVAGSSTIKIYVNGSLLSSSTVNPTNAVNDNSTAVTIGSRFSTGGSHWNGKIANAKIYTRTLSAAEVAQNYETQKSKFANTIVQQGLVLNLDAGNIYSYAGAGGTWFDVSGNANNGTLTSSPTYSVDNGGLILFNGSSQYVAVPNSSSLQVADTFTVCAWIKATTLSGRYGIFSTRATNPAGCWQFEVGTGNGGTGRILMTGLNTFIAESVNDVISTNNWFHICVVKVNNATTGATLYVNGAAVTNSATSAYTIVNNADEKRIAIGTTAAQYFSGSISQLFVYNTALSAAQVLQNYNATKSRFGL